MRCGWPSVRLAWAVLLLGASHAAVRVERNGPGLLVAWDAVADAASYEVQASREPSPSFFSLPSPSCCPVLPDQSRPCCPVDGSRTSLQVEQVTQGLRPSASYRFRVLVTSANASEPVTLGPSAAHSPAAVPSAPGAPTGFPAVPPTSFEFNATNDSHELNATEAVELNDAALNVTWAPPADDGGDLVRAYRLLANVTSLGRVGVVLVRYRSAGARPLAGPATLSARRWERTRAHTRTRPLPPAHHRGRLGTAHSFLIWQVQNNSAGRPATDWLHAAVPAVHYLALLPTHSYTLAVQACNHHANAVNRPCNPAV